MFVVLLSNGDRAVAYDDESAVVAARTLLNDAHDAGASGLTCSFYTDEHLVRAGVSRTDLGGS